MARGSECAITSTYGVVITRGHRQCMAALLLIGFATLLPGSIVTACEHTGACSLTPCIQVLQSAMHNKPCHPLNIR